MRETVNQSVDVCLGDGKGIVHTAGLRELFASADMRVIFTPVDRWSDVGWICQRLPCLRTAGLPRPRVGMSGLNRFTSPCLPLYIRLPTSQHKQALNAMCTLWDSEM